MRMEQQNRLTHTRETAIRLIKCLGMSGAMDFCKDNQWTGIIREIRMLRSERRYH